MDKEPTKGIAAKRYTQQSPIRQYYLDTAYRLASLTLPTLFADTGKGVSPSGAQQTAAQLSIPWTSLGGYGLNNLGAKLTQVWFPASIPYINLIMGPSVEAQMEDMEETDRGLLKAEIDKGLSKVELKYVECAAEDGDRAALFIMDKKLLVAGSHAVFIDPDDSKLTTFDLTEFVTWRNRKGAVIEFVIAESQAWEAMPDDVQALCKSEGYEEGDDEDGAQAPSVTVYTHGRLRYGKWTVNQECWGHDVPDSEATYHKDACPYTFPTLIMIPGEHFGRSYFEDYESDLQTYDSNMQSLIEAGVIAARMNPMVKPGGGVSKRQLEQAANGEVLVGFEGDISYPRTDKGADLNFLVNQTDKIEERLLRICVVTSAIQRPGERVTAEEIKIMARELDETLGGVYANGSVSIQAPVARLKFASLMRQGRLPKLPKDSVKVSILTGDAALGRLQKASVTDEWLGTSGATITALGPAASYIRLNTYLTRGASNRGIDTDGLLKSEEEVQGEMAKQQQAELAAQVAPEVIKQGGSMLQNKQQSDLSAQQPAEAQQ